MNTYKRFVLTLYLAFFITAHAFAQEGLDFTQCAINNYPLFINGMENIVKGSDPISVSSMMVNLPDHKYEMKNAQLKGMKGCTVTELTINKNALTFQYNLECPHLEGNGEFNVQGQIGDLQLNGEGAFSFTCDDCLILMSGNYEKNVGKDSQEHVYIKNYKPDFKPRGKLVINLDNAFGGDKVKSDAVNKLLNVNWQNSDDRRAPVVRGFLDVFIENLNAYLQQVSINAGCVSE